MPCFDVSLRYRRKFDINANYQRRFLLKLKINEKKNNYRKITMTTPTSGHPPSNHYQECQSFPGISEFCFVVDFFWPRLQKNIVSTTRRKSHTATNKKANCRLLSFSLRIIFTGLSLFHSHPPHRTHTQM